MPEKPSNVLRVVQNLPKPHFQKPSIGVCVQAFRFGTYDVRFVVSLPHGNGVCVYLHCCIVLCSVRLVEWLEMIKILGADQVYFYVYGATGNMLKVLKHYEKEVFIRLVHQYTVLF